MIDKQIASACWVVCPLCDQETCVGKEKCKEVKAWIEQKQRGCECYENES